jgi:aspartyl aminopeptidase
VKPVPSWPVPVPEVTAALCGLLDASPSPFHAVATASALLDAAGFTAVDERGPFPGGAGGFYLEREGALVAWRQPGSVPAAFRLVGAHTDSPNLRIKPQPDRTSAGVAQLGVEVYGGALWNSWFDLDLGLSGRVAVQGPDGPSTRHLLVDRPVLRIPRLAIHLDRTVNEEGFKPNAQQHLVPMWAMAGSEPDVAAFRRFLAAELDVAAEAILTWDVMVHDLTPARVWGRDGEFLASGRLDNLVSSFCAVRALLATEPDGGATVPAVVLFDHEEIGSESNRGAASALLPHALERIVTAAGGARDDLLRALPASVCLSADMAHATHPNYADRHDPEHHVRLNRGVVVKANANVRYASDAHSVGILLSACADAGVPVQHFVSRSDMPCGSTIGPITAAKLGIPTVDIGIAQLAMHSARETCGAHDPAHYEAAMAAFLSG